MKILHLEVETCWSIRDGLWQHKGELTITPLCSLSVSVSMSFISSDLCPK